MSPSNFTVFLDRDGVINMDSPDYIKCAEEFHFIESSAEAIALLNRRGFDVIVITNQSGVGRGLFTRKEMHDIFDKMQKGVVRAGGTIKDIFFCPHTPKEICSCRKPLSGLILQAMEKYGIDPARSCMVGDSVRDIECGYNAGCGYTVLVRTGNGEEVERIIKEIKIENKKIQAYTDTDSATCISTGCKDPSFSETATTTRKTLLEPDFIANDLMEAAIWISSKISPHY
ncbi:MAG: D-glycero-beta-D-manno-heptose 1,7-bisphosphate 7-phosphatase [Desulfamplus sp.]|nr:D-glycero-beta-D-manno-heptose 1,7-bisphosphate 7-phosphatase [Desulfamplus sp.]